MHSIICILAAFASATSAAVLPRADYGFWNVSVTEDSAANGWRQTEVTAVYSNSQLNGTITDTCTDTTLPSNSPAETLSCNDPSFTYSLGSSVTVTQTVLLNGVNVTLTGSAPIEIPCGGVNGRLCQGSAILQASVVAS